MSHHKRELELKIELSNAQLEQARKSPGLKSMTVGRPLKQRLVSIYYDTANRGLHGIGVSFRVRQVGDQWLQTVKAETKVRGGVSNPIEIEANVKDRHPVVAAISDRSVRRNVKAAIRKEPLVPLFETVVERTTRHLKTADGDEIELALDKGTVRSAGESRDIRVAELELKSGSPAALLAIVPALVEEGPLRLGGASKAELGYLISGEAEDAAAVLPQKAEPAEFKGEQTCLEVLRACCRSATRQIVHNWRVVIESDDPEGPHQMRIGIRRLRIVLRMFRPLVGGDHLRKLNERSGELSRTVGELRDFDVLASEIIRPLSVREGADPALNALLEALAHERSNCREKSRSLLTSRDLTLLQIELALLPECLESIAGRDGLENLSRPFGDLQEKVIAKSWRRVAKRGLRLDQLSVEERHVMRKDLKALRYTIEFMAPLFAKRRIRAFLKEAEHLQNVFGYLNDVALARKLRELRAVAEATDPGVHRAVGTVIGWHEAQAEQAWLAAMSSWKRLAGCPKFWT